jgi:hypothetical protein
VPITLNSKSTEYNTSLPLPPPTSHHIHYYSITKHIHTYTYSRIHIHIYNCHDLIHRIHIHIQLPRTATPMTVPHSLIGTYCHCALCRACGPVPAVGICTRGVWVCVCSVCTEVIRSVIVCNQCMCPICYDVIYIFMCIMASGASVVCSLCAGVRSVYCKLYVCVKCILHAAVSSYAYGTQCIY